MSADAEVVRAATAAAAAHGALRASTPGAVADALAAMASGLTERADAVLEANAADMAAAQGVLGEGMLDRLRLDEDRLARMSEQIGALAALDDVEPLVAVRELPDGLELRELRRPVGVIGANYEARPNVTVDVASQLIKSRNAGVLRTGSAALRSAIALRDAVIGPAMASAGLDPDAIQIVRSADRAAARALVSQPRLISLVILRGSGETTAALAREAATHGVRTLAHAEGGGVLYVHPSADPARLEALIPRSLDRLGVCNRLNLLLIDEEVWDARVGDAVARLEGLGIRASLPPHDHAVGFEWALSEGDEATVTIAPARGPEDAARIANQETSGLAAAIVAEDAGAAERFLAAYGGTGAFWNATTRLLDGFAMLGAPETGINVDHVPGPRGPVTFRDLYLRQYVVVPR